MVDKHHVTVKLLVYDSQDRDHTAAILNWHDMTTDDVLALEVMFNDIVEKTDAKLKDGITFQV